MKKNLQLVGKLVYSTPSPSSISYMWNFGSLLILCMIIQLVTGLFLSFHYSSSISEAFDSVIKICEEVNNGWLIRSMHANGASFFFIFIYFHIARGIYFGSSNHSLTWMVGVVIFMLLMGTAFLGYVLPWGQMSLWGATVITNLLSAIPFVGGSMVEWVWGGFSVSGPTLQRFFSLHFLLPFFIMVMIVIHIMFLHKCGSSNPLGIDLHSDKIFFHPFFIVKDILGMAVASFLFMFISIQLSDLFMDPDNFSLANPLSTPPHIQPEWYFLFAYAILRSIPNKLGGVVGLILSVSILFLLPWKIRVQTGLKKIKIWTLISSFFMLTWIGSMPVEYPFESLGRLFSVVYFCSLLSFNEYLEEILFSISLQDSMSPLMNQIIQ